MTPIVQRDAQNAFLPNFFARGNVCGFGTVSPAAVPHTAIEPPVAALSPSNADRAQDAKRAEEPGSPATVALDSSFLLTRLGHGRPGRPKPRAERPG